MLHPTITCMSNQHHGGVQRYIIMEFPYSALFNEYLNLGKDTDLKLGGVPYFFLHFLYHHNFLSLSARWFSFLVG